MPYNLLLLFFSVFSIMEVMIEKNKTIKLLLLIFVLFGYWIFFGFRGFLGWDWYYYTQFFEKGIGNFEIGFQLYTLLLKNIFDNYFSFIAISTLFDIILLGIFFWRYSPYPILSFCLFFTFNGIVIQVDLLRHMRAFLLFLISLQYVGEKRIIKYFSLNILAICFHKIAICFLPLYFILDKNFIKYKKTILSIIFLNIFLLSYEINLIKTILYFFQDISIYGLGDKIQFYLKGIHGLDKKLGLGDFERIVTFIIFWKYRREIVREFHFGNMMYNLYFLYVTTFLFFHGFRILSDRISNSVFIVSYWIIYPMIIRRNRNIIGHFLYIILISYMFLKVNVKFVINPLHLHSYKNILIQEEDIVSRKKIVEEETIKFIQNQN